MTTRSCRLVGALSAAALLAPWAHTAQGASPGDPLLSRQWGLNLVQAPGAWRTSTGRGVIVAVVDSGTAGAHPDLSGGVLPGRNTLTDQPGADDDCGHGTQVAGVIAARRNNGKGVAGVAPDARILPFKVGGCVDVNAAAVVSAIRLAVAAGARVINLSHATYPVAGQASAVAGFQDRLQQAVDEAWERGVLVVAAAGNFTIPICEYPAKARHVLCVGSVDRNAGRTPYSQGGTLGTDGFLVAPGGGPAMGGENGIWTTTVVRPPSSGDVGSGNDAEFPGYTRVTGTSFAAPHVSGVAALLFSRGYSAAEVRRRILTTARDLGPVGPDPLYGAGLVDAAAALSVRSEREAGR